MKSFIVLLSLLVTFTQAHGQSFKVVKIQGKKAIVEVSDPTMISLNQTYNVGDSAYSSAPSSGGKREHGIAVNFSLLSQTSPSASSMTLGGTYLWNYKKWEAGPTVSLSNSTFNGNSTNLTTLGGVGFWNFTEHRPGVDKILSATGSLTVTSGSGSSTTNIALGPNYRIFMLSQDHCFTLSALYKMAQASGSTVSGFELLAGIATYY